MSRLLDVYPYHGEVPAMPGACADATRATIYRGHGR